MKGDQASGTAALIAASLVMLRANPRYENLVPESSATLAARALEHSSAKWNYSISILKQPWFRMIAKLLERLTTPGIVIHYALRKNCIRGLAREAVIAGIDQVVILGAGFDSLALDLQQEFESTRAWEIDHPATQRIKALALGPALAPRLNLVPADLSKIDLDQILHRTAFRTEQRTLWIAEGLLMYFDESAVSRLFKQAAAMTGTGSRFIFTFMRPDASGRVRFEAQTRLVDWWLQITGEPFGWGTTAEHLSAFIQPWRRERLWGADEMIKCVNETLTQKPAVGEMICLAEL